MNKLKDEVPKVGSLVDRLVMRKCAACGKEKPVKDMKTCMHNDMHRYVCDSTCMVDFYA